MTVNTTSTAREILFQFDVTRPDERKVAADALLDAGHDLTAGVLLAAPAHWSAAAVLQCTEEGERVVTVARDGANMAKVRAWSVPLWRTSVYVARRRQADGVLTWRLDCRCGRAISGKEISGPMIAESKETALALGLDYAYGVRHGDVCD